MGRVPPPIPTLPRPGSDLPPAIVKIKGKVTAEAYALFGERIRESWAECVRIRAPFVVPQQDFDVYIPPTIYGRDDTEVVRTRTIDGRVERTVSGGRITEVRLLEINAATGLKRYVKGLIRFSPRVALAEVVPRDRVTPINPWQGQWMNAASTGAAVDVRTFGQQPQPPLIKVLAYMDADDGGILMVNGQPCVEELLVRVVERVDTNMLDGAETAQPTEEPPVRAIRFEKDE